MKLLLKKFFSLFIISSSLFFVYFYYDDNRIEYLSGLVEKFKTDYYQQKIYLHFDKSAYQTGDDIWFKAYVVDGSNHTPDKKSTNLYIEFINPQKSLVEIKRIQLKNGFGIGDFILHDTIPEGLYQVRAYTNWMKNFDSEFYFTKNIFIKNPGYSRFISPGEARKNKRSVKKNSKITDVDVQFFPEGGNLVQGLKSVVAFKAIDHFGKSIDVTGSIYNSRKNKIIDFTSFHNGMGKFDFMPEKGEKYYSVVEYKNKSFKVELPEPLETGIIMNVRNENPKNIFVSLISNRPVSGDRFANEVVVVAQTRGTIIYKAIHNISEKVNIEIPKIDFPSGIAQITVFSGRFVPLAERLVFIDNEDKINIKIESKGKNKDNLSEFRIKTLNEKGEPVKTNLSLSVLNADKNLKELSINSITDFLLLSSDLKGYIEDPGYYFHDKSPETLQALDNLMLTHGWRRFDWGKLVNNEFPQLEYSFENNITIEGKITAELFGIPIKQSEVTLTILEAYNDVFTQKTGKDGSFKFDGLVYYDTVGVRIEARRPSGKKNLLIVLPETETEEIDNFIGDYTITTVSERNNKEYRKKMNEEMKIRMKEEEERENERNKITGIYGTPDNIIKGEDIPDGYSNVLQAIQGRVPGVDVRGNRVIIRGINTIYGSTEPLYLVDGIPVSDVNSILSIPVTDVDRIEILKGPSAAIYGSRGGNGVIAVYTKRGEFMKKGVIEFGMLGYSTPRLFYQPKFNNNENEMLIEPTTIFWDPVIETNSSGEATLFLEFPEKIQNYRIVVEGLSYDGKTANANIEF